MQELLSQLAAKIGRGGPGVVQRLLDALDSDGERAALSIPNFARDNGISRTTVYEEITAGRLRTMKVGTRRLITREAGREWRHLMEQAAAKSETAA